MSARTDSQTSSTIATNISKLIGPMDYVRADAGLDAPRQPVWPPLGLRGRDPREPDPVHNASPDEGSAPDLESPAPPVRTIVLDRPPVPVAPPVRERNPLREPVPSTAGPERLRVSDLSIAYGGVPAVKSVSLSIHQGEVLALIGPSGCGKTTLLRTLNRLTELTPSAARAGRVLLDGEDIHGLVDTTLRARVAMVFQQPNPFPMSIFDNVAFALREQSRKRPRRRELEPLVIDALRRAGLYEEVRDDLDRPALRLSGGQQQRLCIARAIAPRPEVLLMDEPCQRPGPDLHGRDRGADRRAAPRAGGRDRHPQPRSGAPRRRQGRVHVSRRSDRVRNGRRGVRQPRAARTRDYVQGTFG